MKKSSFLASVLIVFNFYTQPLMASNDLVCPDLSGKTLENIFGKIPKTVADKDYYKASKKERDEWPQTQQALEGNIDALKGWSYRGIPLASVFKESNTLKKIGANKLGGYCTYWVNPGSVGTIALYPPLILDKKD